jgi:hypothetical protein
LEIKVGEEKKINLSSQNYYDLSVRLESIERGRANITLNRIFERIPVTENEERKIGIMNGEDVKETFNPEIILWPIIVVGAIILIELTGGIWLIAKMIKRKKSKNNDGKRKNKKIEA